MDSACGARKDSIRQLRSHGVLTTCPIAMACPSQERGHTPSARGRRWPWPATIAGVTDRLPDRAGSPEPRSGACDVPPRSSSSLHTRPFSRCAPKCSDGGRSPPVGLVALSALRDNTTAKSSLVKHGITNSSDRELSEADYLHGAPAAPAELRHSFMPSRSTTATRPMSLDADAA